MGEVIARCELPRRVAHLGAALRCEAEATTQGVRELGRVAGWCGESGVSVADLLGQTAGDPSAALSAARKIAPQNLPSVERRSRYYTDIAAAYGRWGRRDNCIRALLAAEHHAPEETHARPAVKSLISGLLTSGRTTPELRGLAARSGVLAR